MSWLVIPSQCDQMVQVKSRPNFLKNNPKSRRGQFVLKMFRFASFKCLLEAQNSLKLPLLNCNMIKTMYSRVYNICNEKILCILILFVAHGIKM